MKWMQLSLALFGVLSVILIAEACNEAICGSKVSKCLLINCCDCDMSDKKNCSCCKECHICLADLYTACCSCVGMCPPPDPDMNLFKTSSVELLNDPIPELFNVLTEFPDQDQRWTTYQYPRYQPEETLLEHAIPIGVRETKMTAKYGEIGDNKNCSVAFFSQCMTIHKCKASCKSMGAARYRWFHEYGCCQCVGNTCLNYGLPEPHCLLCPEPEDIEETEISLQVDENHMKVDIASQVKMGTGGV